MLKNNLQLVKDKAYICSLKKQQTNKKQKNKTKHQNKTTTTTTKTPKL